VFMYAWMKKPPPAPPKGGSSGLQHTADFLHSSQQIAISPLSGGVGGASSSSAIQPTLYYVRDFFSNDFDPVIYFGKEKKPVSDFAVYRDTFENCLRICLDRMFDPAIPFTQTIHTKNCSYCPFTGICGKTR